MEESKLIMIKREIEETYIQFDGETFYPPFIVGPFESKEIEKFGTFPKFGLCLLPNGNYTAVLVGQYIRMDTLFTDRPLAVVQQLPVSISVEEDDVTP